MSYHGKQSSFIVRIWWEHDAEEGRFFLRGRVEDAQTGELFYFEEPEVLFDFLLKRLREPIGELENLRITNQDAISDTSDA